MATMPQLAVANNTSLQNINITNAISGQTIVLRAGAGAANDGGAAIYVYNHASCSLNFGNGDNGIQVKANSVGCWNIVPQSNYDVRIWGAVGNGATDNTVAFTNANIALASLGGGTAIVPAGTWLINSNVALGSAVSFTVLPGATLTGSGSLLGTVYSTGNVLGNFGVVSFAATSRGLNTIVGETVNSLAPGSPNLPSGVAGYGTVAAGAAGNQAFGVYGLGELHSTTGGVAIGAEFTARNFSTGTPDINLPPNTAIGTTTNVVDGENITCGTEVGAKNCSIGLYISNESGNYTDPIFTTGEYIYRYANYGLFVESQPSGVQTSAVIKNNGNGTALQLQTTNVTPNARTLISTDGTTTHFSIDQAGDIYSTAKLEFSQPSRPSLSSNCSGSGSSLNHSTDQAGIITTPTGGASGGQCTVNFATTFVNIPSCTVTGENVSGLAIITKSISFITVGGLSASTTQNFDYHCIDQN